MNTIPISAAQRKILADAPQLLSVVGDKGQKYFILDTPKDRDWAVKERGAIGFSCLTSHHVGPSGVGSDYRKGDFYCVVSDANTEFFTQGSQAESLSDVTAEILLRVRHLFSHVFNVEDLRCRFTFIQQFTLGISISSAAFGLPEGAPFLEDLYREAANRLSASARSFGLKFVYNEIVPAEVNPLSAEIYTKFSQLNKASVTRAPLRPLVSNLQFGPDADPNNTISLSVLAQLKQAAARRWHVRRDKNWWRLPPDASYLTDMGRAPFGDPMRIRTTQFSAQKVLSWISKKELTEFGQRNAQRGIGKTKLGRNNEGGGTEDALRLLTEARYLFKCPTPSLANWRKGPSPWYLVNPLQVVGSTIL